MTATVAQISTMLGRFLLNGKVKITLKKFTMVHLQYQYRIHVLMYASLLIIPTGLTVDFPPFFKFINFRNRHTFKFLIFLK